MFANQLFAGIREGRENTTFEVKLSMLEIYNEVARDLLDAKSTGKKQGLKIRQHPKKGFYGKKVSLFSWSVSFPPLITAEGLKDTMVASYEEIDAKIEEGTVNRTVASTNMNATSSRAHTIVGITFVQKTKNNAGKEMAKTAVVNLVDLAGRYYYYKAKNITQN